MIYRLAAMRDIRLSGFDISAARCDISAEADSIYRLRDAIYPLKRIRYFACGEAICGCAARILSTVVEEDQVVRIVAFHREGVYRQGQVDAPVDGFGKHLLHVVQMGLGHVDAV